MSEREVVFITGANRGIGLGLAREFARIGWHVFGGCRKVPVGLDSGEIEWVVLDVADESSVRNALAEIASRVPHLDVLVNNAGINPEPHDAGVLDIPIEVVMRAFDVNTAGAVRVLQASAALLRLSPNPRVVNVSSGAGSLAHNRVEKRLPAYCISKAALNMFTQRAARELTDMTVVSVTPGWVRTDMGGSDASLGVDEVCEALAKTITALNRSRSGEWIDRFGNTSEFSW